MPRRIITDITEAREVSLVRRGANQHAHVLLRKTADTPLPSNTDESAMSVKNLQKIAAFDEDTRKHFATLDEAGATAFLEKSAADQAAEVTAAKAKKPDGEMTDDEKKKAEADAAAAAETGNQPAGLTKAEVEDMISKATAPYKEQIESLTQKSAESDLEKTARDPAYAGFPGGTEAVVQALSKVAGQPAEVIKLVEDGLKAQAATARLFGGASLGVHTQKDVEGTVDHTVENAAKELMKADPSLTIEAARGKAMADNPDLLMKALDQETAQAA